MDNELFNTHLLLVRGEGYESCRDHILAFFQKNVLVKYDRVTVVAEASVCARQERFASLLEAGMQHNRETLQQLLAVLQQEGFGELGKWQKMSQGYASKTLHEIAHLLDGFFGIDSAFYNLIEDSHWVSTHLHEAIRRDPDRYWLIRADGISQIAQADRVPFLRRHGTE
jgi:hypothetical protein